MMRYWFTNQYGKSCTGVITLPYYWLPTHYRILHFLQSYFDIERQYAFTICSFWQIFRLFSINWHYFFDVSFAFSAVLQPFIAITCGTPLWKKCALKRINRFFEKFCVTSKIRAYLSPTHSSGVNTRFLQYVNNQHIKQISPILHAIQALLLEA